MHQLRRAVTEVLSVRYREEQIEIRADERVHAHIACAGQYTLMGSSVRQPREPRDGVSLAQRLVRPEKEDSVAEYRAAQRAAVLIALEIRKLACCEVVAG